MVIDVLTLITPDPAVLGNNYLSGSTPNITYVGPPDANGLRDLVYMKGLGGSPWDWLTVGEDFIFQRMTENIWGDPSTGKLMFGKGSPRFPRYIDYTYPTTGVVASTPVTTSLEGAATSGRWSFLVSPEQTSYVIYGPGGVPTSRSGDNFVRNTFHGPYVGAAIIDSTGKTLLPAGEDWLADYEWGGKVATGPFGVLERVFHRRGYGRYGWQSFTAVNGVYPTTPNASSQTAKITPMPATAVVPIQKVF